MVNLCLEDCIFILVRRIGSDYLCVGVSAEKAVNVEENLVKEEVETTKVEEKDSKPAEEKKSSTQNSEEVV